MRRRLVISYLAVMSATLLLLCIPLMVVAGTLIRQDFDHRLDRNAQNMAAAIVQISTTGRPVGPQQLTGLLPSGRRATYTADGGAPISVGVVRGAVRSSTVALPGGQLRMDAPVSLLHSRQLRVRLLIAGLGLVTLLVAAALALWQATRISLPLGQLADTAERFGRGDLRPGGVRYTVPELSRLASVLDSAAANLASIIESERRFARDTSHQLRTPLASLSIRLEDMRRTAADPHQQAELDSALDQIHRLSDVVANSLTPRPRAGSAQMPIDVADVLEQLSREWTPVFARAGRRLEVIAEPVSAIASPGALAQAVSTLLENALHHGAGAATVRTRDVASHVAIDVTDDGPGIPEELTTAIFERDISGRGSTGLGLPLARSLIEADGGRLELTRRVPPQFTIFLAAGRDSA